MRAGEWSMGGEMTRGTFISTNCPRAYSNLDTARGDFLLFSVSVAPPLPLSLPPPPLSVFAPSSRTYRASISLCVSLPLCVCVFGILTDTEGGH